MPIEDTAAKIAANEVSREKYWNELSADEKVERMRQVVHSMQYQLEYANEQLHKMRGHLYKHYHDANGKLVAPINEHDSIIGGGGLVGSSLRSNKNPNEVYF